MTAARRIAVAAAAVALGLAVVAGPAVSQTPASPSPASPTPTSPPSTAPADLPISFGGPFSLVDHDGRPVTDRTYRGRFMLVYFGYTHCPDICPHNLLTMSEALDSLGSRADSIQPLFVTTDPARDTVETMRDYVSHFRAGLVGLTGDETAIADAARAYRVHRRKVVLPDSRGEDDYLVTHGSLTYLMGPDGRFVTMFPHDTRPEAMATILRRYVGASAPAH
jgi:protein SCO1/2